MRTYGTITWRRVLALTLVFIMMFSTLGTSGYSVFALDLQDSAAAESQEPAEEIVVDEQQESTAPDPAAESSVLPRGSRLYSV